MKEGRILIVDDEKNIIKSLATALGQEGYQAEGAGSGEAALKMISQEQFALVMLDIKMPGIDGIEVLKRIKRDFPLVVVIMMSAHSTIETAVTATKLGAYNFIEKPFDLDKILLLVENALRYQKLQKEVASLKDSVAQKYHMVGRTKVMENLITQVERAAPSESWVLINGENGTGKELVAWAVHHKSRRREGPFIRVNCAAIPTELIESELFGHEKGSFTGAFERKTGKFEQANGGSLFLDEVGDMSLSTQAKVLRALQEQEIERVGGPMVKVDIRVISATNKDLAAEIKRGNFREDLFYRLHVIPIDVPPLRERIEDIPELLDYFFARQAAESGLQMKTLTAEALEKLKQHTWPGNVRELKNTAERLMIMVRGGNITLNDIYAQLPNLLPLQEREWDEQLNANKSLREILDEQEKRIILTVLKKNQGNVNQTANQLKIERSHLYRKMRSFNIDISKRS